VTEEVATVDKLAAKVQATGEEDANFASPLHCLAVNPTARGDEVDTITEPTLAEFIENGAISGITLKETPDGFQVWVSVHWDKKKEFILITQRTKQPKLWSSLSRLVESLSRYPNLPTIKLEVRTAKHAPAARKSTKKKKA